MAKVQVNESLIGRKVTLVDGTATKITGVTTRGYKLKDRAKQLIAISLVKVGAKFIEIEKPKASEIEDSGKGFANIIDPDLYEEVFGKPMKGAKAKAKTPAKSKTKSKKTPAKSKAKSKSKPKKERVVKKEHVDSFATKEILEPLISKVSEAVRAHIDSNYTYDGELEINTEVFAPEIVDDPNGPVISINCSVVQELPEQEVDVPVEVTMSLKAKKIVTKGLWEKVTKAQAKAEAAFGAPLTVGSLLESEKGTEFLFAGARKTEEGARLVFDATGDKEVVKQLTIARASELLSFVTPDEDEVDFDDDDMSDDDFDFADGDELDADESSEMASTLTEDVFEQFEGNAEAIAEYLLENYTTDVMITYVEENYEESREINKIINSEDALKLAELIADTETPEEDGEELEDGDELDDMDMGDDLDELGDLDEDEAGDEIDEDDFDEGDAELDEEGDESELDDEVGDGELDIDVMADALIDGDFVGAKELRRMEDADIIAAYEKAFPDDEAEELPSVDEMVDELLDADALDPKAVRRMTDADITSAYLAHTQVEVDGDELLDGDDLDDELDESLDDEDGIDDEDIDFEEED